MPYDINTIATGYFQDGRGRKTRSEVDWYLERSRGICDISAF